MGQSSISQKSLLKIGVFGAETGQKRLFFAKNSLFFGVSVYWLVHGAVLQSVHSVYVR